MARPTKSAAFYTQCIGRGTRRYPGKENCLVLDFYDHRHDVCSLSGMFEEEIDNIVDGESVKKAAARKERKRYLPTMLYMEVKEQEVDLLGKSKFRWRQRGEVWELPIQPKEDIHLIPIAIDRYSVLLVKDQKKEVLYESLGFGYAQGVSEDYARRYGRNFSRRDAAWIKQPATQKQIRLLLNYGIDPSNLTRGEASKVIDRIISRKCQ